MLDRERVDGLEAYGHFESSRDLTREVQRQFADRIGVGLDGDTRERSAQRRDVWNVACRNRSAVEEIARVVEFQAGHPRFVRGSQGVGDLPWERAGWRRSVDGPAPQVAERARKRTLTASEKERQRTLDRTVRSPLVFDQRTVSFPRVDGGFGTAECANPAVSD